MPIPAWLPAAAGVAGAVFGHHKDASGKDVGPLAGLGGDLIKGGLGLTGSLLGSHAAGEAADLQAKSTAEALAFEREKEAERRREYELDRVAQQRQWEARENFLNPYRRMGASVLARYGAEIPENFADAPPEEPDVQASSPFSLGSLTARGLYGR